MQFTLRPDSKGSEEILVSILIISLSSFPPLTPNVTTESILIDDFFLLNIDVAYCEYEEE